MEPGGDADKRDVRRPMNAFLIFCKRHRSIVREKNPDLDNRSVTRILGDLWANLKDSEKVVYTDLAKQYKDAFMKANPDYKWHNPEKTAAAQKLAMPKPTNVKVIRNDLDVPESSIIPGKLADPSNMGGLSLLLIAGQQSDTNTVVTSPKPVAMEATDCNPETVSLPVNKVKWDEESWTRCTQGEPVQPILKEDLAVKSEQGETRECCPETGLDKALNVRSETSPYKQSESGLTDMGSEKTDTSPGKVTSVKTESRQHVGEPVWNLEGRKMENQTKHFAQVWKTEHFTKEKEASNRSLLALAEMCEGKATPMSATDGVATKPLLYQAVGAPKVPQRSLLAEAFLDTCDKGNYSDILKDNSAGSKISIGDNQFKMDNSYGNIENGSEFDEKENISKLMMKDVKNCKDSDEESPLITCGKLVVNHIIDRLFSSDIATAARKAQNGHTEKTEAAETRVATLETKPCAAGHANGVHERSLPDHQRNTIEGDIKNYNCDYDEHDGTKNEANMNRCTGQWSGSDTRRYSVGDTRRRNIGDTRCGNISDTRRDSISDENSASHYNDHCEAGFVNQSLIGETADGSSAVSRFGAELTSQAEAMNQEPADAGPDSRKPASPAPGVREEEGYGEGEVDDTEDFQPVRKSRRRNRGQRYQELINEGIIQPSKERMAALKQDPPKEDCCEEDFQSIDSYILPETAIRRIRKRTTSESAKDKILPMDDAKRYKTGDFDLEAHIATLPACPVESMGRKRGFIRQRHHSENIHIKKSLDETHIPVFDIKKTVSLPPHVKIPSPEKTLEPVVGSRKRKARKHSITHLLPAPPVLVSNDSEHKTSIGVEGGTEGVLMTDPTADGQEDGIAANSEDQLTPADSSDSTTPSNLNDHAITNAGPSQRECGDKLTVGGDSSLESQHSDAASNGSRLIQDSPASEGDSQSSKQTGLQNRSSTIFLSQSKTGGVDTSVLDTKHSNCTEQLGADAAAYRDSREALGSANNRISINSNELGQKGSHFNSWEPEPNLIPGDQSGTLLHAGCRSEVRLDTGQRTERCLSKGNENQICGDKKDTDMNFNTKVHC